MWSSVIQKSWEEWCCCPCLLWMKLTIHSLSSCETLVQSIFFKPFVFLKRTLPSCCAVSTVLKTSNSQRPPESIKTSFKTNFVAMTTLQKHFAVSPAGNLHCTFVKLPSCHINRWHRNIHWEAKNRDIADPQPLETQTQDHIYHNATGNAKISSTTSCKASVSPWQHVYFWYSEFHILKTSRVTQFY